MPRVEGREKGSNVPLESGWITSISLHLLLPPQSFCSRIAGKLRMHLNCIKLNHLTRILCRIFSLLIFSLIGYLTPRYLTCNKEYMLYLEVQNQGQKRWLYNKPKHLSSPGPAASQRHEYIPIHAIPAILTSF